MRSVCSAMGWLRAAGCAATSPPRRRRGVIGKLVHSEVRAEVRGRARLRTDGRPAERRVGAGAGLGVACWDTAGRGLFGTSRTVSGGSRNGPIPAQFVAQDGASGVPFADRVPGAGRRRVEVQKTIER